MAVDRARRGDEPAGRNDPGGRVDHHVDAVLDVRVAGVADARDLAVLDADVRLHDAEHRVDHEGAGDAEVEGRVAAAGRLGEHAVADVAAGADQAFLSDRHQVPLDAGEQVRVAQPYQVALGRPVQRAVDRAVQREGHSANPCSRAFASAAARTSGVAHIAVDQPVEAANDACPAEGAEPDLPGLARLEAHGHARRDVEPHAERLLARKPEGAIDLEEVVVRRDLDSPVERVRDLELDGVPAGVALDRLARRDDLTGDHDGGPALFFTGKYSVTSCVPSSKSPSIWSRPTRSATPSSTSPSESTE